MDLEAYEAMYRLEEMHWWYAGMRRITAMLVAKAIRGQSSRGEYRVLDAGCGTGGILSTLQACGPVTGCDVSPVALRFCRQRNLARLCQSSVAALPFADGTFDLITSLDVLYHRAVGDYRRALAEARRVLRPGGHLIVRVAAYDWLRGKHDQLVHTAHRFTAGELGRALSDGGWAVEKLSYANTLLFPAAVVKRLLEPVLPAGGPTDIRPNPAWLDAFLARFLYVEAGWLARSRLPFGLSVVALARKLG